MLARQPERLAAVHRDLQTALESSCQSKSKDKKKTNEIARPLSADKGFCPKADELEELREELSGEVEYLSVPKRLSDAMMSEYQKFRAGIEGTISCLKRVFRLARCCFLGFKNFCSAVFCHNLIVIVRQEEPG